MTNVADIFSMILRKMSAVFLIPALLLTGCSTDPEQIEFNKWKKETYKVESLSYDNSDLKGEAQKELKPVLDSVNKVIPNGRFKVKIDVVKDDNWKRNICKNYVDVAGEQILAPLDKPIIGFSDAFTAAGYVSVSQLKELAKTLNTSLEEKADDERVLDGSNAEYPFEAKKYTIVKETETFKVVLTADSGWNALIWEEYYTEDDPGKIDTKDFPIPSDAYMPFKLEVYYKPACVKL